MYTSIREAAAAVLDEGSGCRVAKWLRVLSDEDRQAVQDMVDEGVSVSRIHKVLRNVEYLRTGLPARSSFQSHVSGECLCRR